MITGDTSDLDDFIYAGSPILPEKESYSLKTPDGKVVSNIKGGLPKQQLQLFNAPYVVSVSYVALDAFKIDYIENFIKRNNGQKFIAYLALSNSTIEPFVVQYSGQPSISKTGFNGSVSLTLQVDNVTDRCMEQVLQDWGECVGNPYCIWTDVNEGVSLWP